MKMLFIGYNLEKLADDVIAKYEPGMEIIDGVVYVANLEVEFESSDFNEVATIVGEGTRKKDSNTRYIYFPNPSDDEIRMTLHKFAQIISNKGG